MANLTAVRWSSVFRSHMYWTINKALVSICSTEAILSSGGATKHTRSTVYIVSGNIVRVWNAVAGVSTSLAGLLKQLQTTARKKGRLD